MTFSSRVLGVLAVALTSGGAFMTSTVSSAYPPPGNGAPSGPHYNLNLIGKNVNQIGGEGNQGNGHRIFVLLNGVTRINLRPGEFDVVDYNGTDGTAAFQLPNPDPDGDGITEYSVYIRALGPGGNGTIATCATDPGDDGEVGTPDDEEVCNTGENVVVLQAHNGPPKFKNVSKQLLFVWVDLDGDGNTERVPLFDEELEGYFWKYDNNGLKVVQMRFYEIPTDVN